MSKYRNRLAGLRRPAQVGEGLLGDGPTGSFTAPGTTLELDAPLERVPVFVREGPTSPLCSADLL
ncbi:hypothetical protein ACFV2X_53790 [Streptomyces sp. NPDC059679]|uniref:hypothetical protein n=1 Tax=Streptomyces sp. NPDC059679 TaxID=3346903 RepID=UPI003687CA22